MANNIYAHTKEAVRVKVKKCELNCPPEWRKFSVDPQITSLEVLYSLLAKAFDIKSDFAIKYKAYDPAGNEMFLAVLSDWDLDAAFLRIHNLSMQTATEPCLFLQIDIKPFTEVKEWDAETPPSAAGDIYGKLPTAATAAVAAATSSSSSTASTNNTRELITPLQQSLGASQKYVQNMQTKLPGLIMNQMEKTFSIVQKAFNLSEETMASLPPRAPLSDTEFRLFLDSLGQIQRCDELRKVIFLGGIDASLRRVVWKHILNVYPEGMTGKQRMDYMRQKSEHYHKLRDTWKAAVKKGCVAGELSYVTSMVKKDVLRTDRLHPFYAGSDDNQNIASLFNILTTYALNHPTVSYCQGMSDIASPLLVTMNDEAQAYICFCAIMARLRVNFMLDGIAMTQKFAHLTEALSFYDPEFWDYLKSQQADDLLFCYRWLLLELKREFPFEDALRMLEVQWSSLKYERSIVKDLALYEKEFTPVPESSAPTTSSSLSSSFGAALPINSSFLQAKTRENAYTKVCALRRQSSSASLSSLSSSLGTSCNALNATRLDSTKRLNQSLDDNLTRHSTRRSRHASAKAHQSLDESKMLSLMEGMEGISKVQDDDQLSKTTETSNSTCATDADDDDVFVHVDGEHDAEIGANKVEAFNFHPTNPFIEDAQLDASTAKAKLATLAGITADATFRDKCSANSNAFLSSSSISDDDVVSGGGGGGVLTATKSDPVRKTKSSAFVPKSIMKLHNKNIISNYNTVSNIIVKQIANAAGTGGGGGDAEVAAGVGNTKKVTSSGGGGHFRDLKEKIAMANKRSMTLDDLNNSTEKSQQKLVKNFNEFLNFAALNKSRIADKLSTNIPSSTTATTTIATTKITTTTNYINDKSKTPSPTSLAQRQAAATTPHPLVQLTKTTGCYSSFDDSDSSSIPEATWSCSTAATAIQQTNNLSNYSLQLELNSHCSPSSSNGNILGKTPLDETPELCGDESNDKEETFKNLPNDPSLTPDDSQDQDYYPMTTAITRELCLESENLDRQVFGEPKTLTTPAVDLQASNENQTEIEYEKLDKDSLELVDELKENEIMTCSDVNDWVERRRERVKKLRAQSNHAADSNTRVAATAQASQADIENQTEAAYEKLNTDSLGSADEQKENETITTADVNDWIVRRRERVNKLRAQINHVAAALDTNNSWPSTDTNTQQSLSEDSLNTNTTMHGTATMHATPASDSAATTAYLTTSLEALTLNPFIDETVLLTTQIATSIVSTTPTLLHTSNSLPEEIVPIALETHASNLPTSYGVANSDEAPIEVATNAADEIAFAKPSTSPLKVAYANDSSGLTPPTLPPPSEFGGGNPFLMFLCLTLLLQHRNTIMKSGMDYNEIAMHFDKMVRKHDVTRVLNQARRMYIDYLKTQAAYKQRLQAYEAQRDVNRNGGVSGGSAATNATISSLNARATT